MKKILASLTLGVLLLPIAVSAQLDWGEGQIGVERVLNNAINWLFYILIFAAVIVIILAAYTFLTAGGNPDNVKKARDYVLYALIALVVAFLARALVDWLLEVIGA